jgi:acyl-CoA reductase-like NAD-dependent aldehyde dehydrogenase
MSVTEPPRPHSAALLRQAQLLIAGTWVDSASGETLSVENPGRRQTIADIPWGGAVDVEHRIGDGKRTRTGGWTA